MAPKNLSAKDYKDKSRRMGSEGAVDGLSEHFSCRDVIPGGLEVQGLRKGPCGVLTSGAAEQNVLSCLGFFLTPRAKSRVWAVPIGVAQEVGSGQLHPEETCGCVSREWEA